MINAGVASALTGAVGVTTSEICYNNVKRFLEGKPVDWSGMFESEEFSKRVTEAFKLKNKL